MSCMKGPPTLPSFRQGHFLVELMDPSLSSGKRLPSGRHAIMREEGPRLNSIS